MFSLICRKSHSIWRVYYHLRLGRSLRSKNNKLPKSLLLSNAAPGRLSHPKNLPICVSRYVIWALTTTECLTRVRESVGRSQASCNLRPAHLQYHRSGHNRVLEQAFLIQLIHVSLHNEVSI